jgi:uncharacterized membrane protein YfcA
LELDSAVVFVWAALAAAAFFAGVVDAVIGGGGMLQIPALFAFMPGIAPPPLLGTNKLASAIGTTGAAIQYARSVATPWRTVIPCMAVAFVAALAGAYAVTLIPAEPLKKALPFILAALLVYTWASGTGRQHAPTRSPSKGALIASSGSGVIGFYDGFLGAGTGAFYKLLFVRGLGFSFLNAAAPAKFTNVASNVGAVVAFAATGYIFWALGLFMAAANFAGGQVGARLALRYGNDFIRRAFYVLVSLLIAKTFSDAYL